MPGADAYVKGYSHDAYRAILPHFIQAYKAGKTKVKPREHLEDVAIAWYRRTPASAGHHGGKFTYNQYGLTMSLTNITRNRMGTRRRRLGGTWR